MLTIYNEIQDYVLSHKDETINLLIALTEIPAPTGDEGLRAAFILNWLKEKGIDGAFTDEAGNVICPYAFTEEQQQNLLVVMAHMDTVFTEKEPFRVVEDGAFLRAPGIGDDTANLVNMLMTIKFLWERKERIQQKYGVLFVANVGEEGLGNLKGSRAIYNAYKEHIKMWVSIDLYYNCLYNSAVGSHRYEVKVKTKGGHSFGDFGNANAIAELSHLVHRLYQQQVPTFAKTTYNVGMIQGGTSVNTIAQEASMLYEFRSESEEGLRQMKESFDRIIEEATKRGVAVQMTELGIRPGNGDIDVEKEEKLCNIMKRSIAKYYDGPVKMGSASTDCNIPLSKGIPAACFGAVMGDGLHTKEEWIEKDSMVPGQMIALDVILSIMTI